jgi:hypothetical protein
MPESCTSWRTGSCITEALSYFLPIALICVKGQIKTSPAAVSRRALNMVVGHDFFSNMLKNSYEKLAFWLIIWHAKKVLLKNIVLCEVHLCLL